MRWIHLPRPCQGTITTHHSYMSNRTSLQQRMKRRPHVLRHAIQCPLHRVHSDWILYLARVQCPILTQFRRNVHTNIRSSLTNVLLLTDFVGEIIRPFNDAVKSIWRIVHSHGFKWRYVCACVCVVSECSLLANLFIDTRAQRTHALHVLARLEAIHLNSNRNRNEWMNFDRKDIESRSSVKP